jgi:hypothetical protein
LKSKVHFVLASNILCRVYVYVCKDREPGRDTIKTDHSGITLGDFNSYLSTFFTKPEAKVLDHCREPGTHTHAHTSGGARSDSLHAGLLY